MARSGSFSHHAGVISRLHPRTYYMTYDDADEVRQLARRHDLDTALVPMKNTHHAEMNELLIGRNLDWVR